MREIKASEVRVGDYVCGMEWWHPVKSEDNLIEHEGLVVEVSEGVIILEGGAMLWRFPENEVAASQMLLVSRMGEVVGESGADNATFVTSESGGRKGAKLPRFHDIPTDSLWELAEHYGKGAEKYPDSPDDEGGLPYANWRRGYNWSLCYSAAYRHLTLAMGGEDVDPETGSKHLTAVAWHMMTLIHWLNDPEMKKYDDRPAILEKSVNDAD